MEIKNLYTCGCSFMSVDCGDDPPVISFLEIYARQKNLQHVSLGRSGATNFLIRLQIEEAIKQHADYIVIGTTSNDRIDLVTGQTHLPITIQDVDYRGYGSNSQFNIVNESPTIISDSITNWTENLYELGIHGNRTRPVSEHTIEAIKHYVSRLHDSNLSIMKDYYMIADGLRKLISLGKEFILIPSISMRDCDWSFVGNRLWNGKLPWEMPYGFKDNTITHNPQSAHDLFAEILSKITGHWG